MNFEKALWQSSGVFAPDYPRQASSSQTIQAERYSRSAFCNALTSAVESGMPGYYSVYSFPRGHSQDGNIPKVDCIFIDLDVEGENYDPKNEKTNFGDWKRDISALLTRARMIASAILDAGEEQHFRVVLSGHKGLHLYLDFPTIAANNGDFTQFKAGLSTYGEQVMSWLENAAGGVEIGPWVDVDASDLGRLARHPNTIHHGAKYDDVERWCVPITVEELSELHVDDYLDLTREPRTLDQNRVPSDSAGKKVVQAIRNATPDKSSSRSAVSGDIDYRQIEKYEGEENEDITLGDIDFLTSNKPCIKAFRKRDDAYDHGNASHFMELNIIARLVEMRVPRDVIHDFFAKIPGYREAITDEQIDKIIARKYSEFNCENVANQAPQFCLGSDCAIYERSDDIQK
jgi:hypothetical protein